MHGLLSDPVTPICVRQWCQLSKLLYNIAAAAKALANLITTDKMIKGMQTEDH